MKNSIEEEPQKEDSKEEVVVNSEIEGKTSEFGKKIKENKMDSKTKIVVQLLYP